MTEWQKKIKRHIEMQNFIEQKICDALNDAEKEITQKLGIDCENISYEWEEEQILQMDHLIEEMGILLAETIEQNLSKQKTED